MVIDQSSNKVIAMVLIELIYQDQAPISIHNIMTPTPVEYTIGHQIQNV